MEIPQRLQDCESMQDVRLFAAISKQLHGTAAEAGVACGNTASLLLELFDKVYLIDLWPHHGDDDMEECMRNLAPYKDKMVVFRGLSWEMAEKIPDESLDFVYIDADHEYESIKKDLIAFYPKVRSGVGAIMSGHDYSVWFPGVPKAVDEFVLTIGSPYLHKPMGESQSWAFEKP